MSKITANETHRFDDIADTVSDAIKLALIDKTLIINNNQYDKTAAIIRKNQRIISEARKNIYNS
jgi:hypothetical protein